MFLGIENDNREKAGHSGNERTRKVQIEACMIIENRHEIFDPI